MENSRQQPRWFSEILDANKGIGPGFDLLRLCLALSIVASHCSALTANRGLLSHAISDLIHMVWPVAGGGAAVDSATVGASIDPVQVTQGVHGPARPYTLARVPMFFALSGFLVTGSALRTKGLVRFLGLRVIRILPALLVEVTLSAVILGGAFTTLPLSAYYASGDFASYFLNIVGSVHFRLPGVFEDHVSRTVNGNLWTLPSEFHSYLLTAILILFGLVEKRLVISVVFLCCTIALMISNFAYGSGETNLGLDGNVSVYYFFMGMIFYLWRDKIPHRLWMFSGSIIVLYGLMMSSRTVYVYPVLLTYVTLFIGLSPLPTVRFLKTGDYSYGVYLYSYPITQAIISLVPGTKNNIVLLLPITVVVTFVFAFLSWHVVEKRFLSLKRYLSPRSAQIAEAMHSEDGQDLYGTPAITGGSGVK